jgi:hypothetical protein
MMNKVKKKALMGRQTVAVAGLIYARLGNTESSE